MTQKLQSRTANKTITVMLLLVSYVGGCGHRQGLVLKIELVSAKDEDGDSFFTYGLEVMGMDDDQLSVLSGEPARTCKNRLGFAHSGSI
jgi:hypothetical protein